MKFFLLISIFSVHTLWADDFSKIIDAAGDADAYYGVGDLMASSILQTNQTLQGQKIAQFYKKNINLYDHQAIVEKMVEANFNLIEVQGLKNEFTANLVVKKINKIASANEKLSAQKRQQQLVNMMNGKNPIDQEKVVLAAKICELKGIINLAFNINGIVAESSALLNGANAGRAIASVNDSEQIKAMTKEAIIVSSLPVYSQLSVTELKEYVTFLEKPLISKYYQSSMYYFAQSLRQSIAKGLKNQSGASESFTGGPTL